MEKKNHNRSSSHGRKLQTTNLKPTRPALHKRHSSYNHAAASHLHASPSTCKLTLGAPKKSGTEIISTDEEETGMASFLQFCATCEKQIVSPGTSILYCSESCRRKDVSKQNPDPALYSPSIIPQTQSCFDPPPNEILPQRSPTVLRPLSFTSDLSLSDSGSPPKDSEALRYLSQFHSQSYQPQRHQRPRPNRSSTATTESTGIPSLTHTPSSSIGTAGSMSSYRPLPPRHDPLSSGHGPSRSVDLVIPVYPATEPPSGSLQSSVSTITPANPTEVSEDGEVQFSKRQQQGNLSGRSEPGVAGFGGAAGSLKQLFGHEAMRSEPS